MRSIKEEALERMILMGEASLRSALQCYLSHYHAERNHQGLDNQLIAPDTVVGQVPQCGYCQSGQIMQAVALLGRSPNRQNSYRDGSVKP